MIYREWLELIVVSRFNTRFKTNERAREMRCNTAKNNTKVREIVCGAVRVVRFVFICSNHVGFFFCESGFFFGIITVLKGRQQVFWMVLFFVVLLTTYSCVM